MDAGLIARRYATVLYDFAKDKQKLDDVYADAQTLRKAMASQPEAQEFFESPTRKVSEKRQLVEAAFKSAVCPETFRFLEFLVEKERISFMSAIMLVFEMLYKKDHNVCTATITTAKQLTEQQQAAFTEQLKAKLIGSGRTVESVDATFKVQPEIIGGLILAVDGMQLDDSVLTKLKNIERQLIA